MDALFQALVQNSSDAIVTLMADGTIGFVSETSVRLLGFTHEERIGHSGFALIRNAIVDQHFLRRKRHNRLISVVLERPPHLGAGIDESTALIVHADGHWTVSGASVVVIYDARTSRITTSTTSPLGASDMRMHVLPAGSSFDPQTGRAMLP